MSSPPHPRRSAPPRPHQLLTSHGHPAAEVVGAARVPHVLRGGRVVGAGRGRGRRACVSAAQTDQRAGLRGRRAGRAPPVEATGPSYLKKGFFRSRRLLDLEPVWSTWATILMS